MRAHLIKDGIVVNTIEVENLNFEPGLIDAASGGSIGDLWDGVKFTTPAPAIIPPTQSEIDRKNLTDHLTVMQADLTLPINVRVFAAKLRKLYV